MSGVSKVYLQVKVSPTLKQAIRDYAETHDLLVSDVVRSCVASKIGYDLKKDDYRFGPSRGDDNGKEKE